MSKDDMKKGEVKFFCERCGRETTDDDHVIVRGKRYCSYYCGDHPDNKKV
jgi:hypothetical protein